MQQFRPQIRNGKVLMQCYGFEGYPLRNGYLRVNQISYGGVLYPDEIEVITKADGAPIKPAPSPYGGKAFISKQIAVVSVKASGGSCCFSIELFRSENGKLTSTFLAQGITVPPPDELPTELKEFGLAIETAASQVKGQVGELKRFEKSFV